MRPFKIQIPFLFNKYTLDFGFDAQQNHILNTMHRRLYTLLFIAENLLKINSHCLNPNTNRYIFYLCNGSYIYTCIHILGCINNKESIRQVIGERFENTWAAEAMSVSEWLSVRKHRFTGENVFSIEHRPYLHNKLPVVSIYYAIVDYSSQMLFDRREHKYLTWDFKSLG